MTERTDEILARYLRSDPALAKAHMTDPMIRATMEVTRRALGGMDRAMAEEGISGAVRERVANRFVWGQPEGRVDWYDLAEMTRCTCGQVSAVESTAESWVQPNMRVTDAACAVNGLRR